MVTLRKKRRAASKAETAKDTVSDSASREGSSVFLSDEYDKLKNFSKHGRALIELAYFFWDSDIKPRYKWTVFLFILIISLFTVGVVYLFSMGSGSVINYYGNNSPVYHGAPQHNLPEPDAADNAVPPAIEDDVDQKLTSPSARGHLSSLP